MKKTSVSTTGSENRLSYLDNYEEIAKYKKKIKSKKNKQNKKSNFDDSKDVILSRGIRWFLFFLFIILQILMNVDHGTFPAATEEIRKDLDIDDNILGIFGSLVFLGNLIGKFF